MGRPANVPDLLARRAGTAPGAVALAVAEGPERPIRAGGTGPERPIRAGGTGPERPIRAGGTGPGAGGDRQLTLGSWHTRSNAAARGLASRGVRAGDRVALLFDNARWLDLAVGYLGVLKAGGIAVPLSARFPRLDLDRALRHSTSRLVICPVDLRPSTGAWTCVDVAELEAGEAADPFPIPVPIGEGDPAEVLYTEGAMRGPVALTSSHGDLLTDGPGFGIGPFVHALLPGTAAGRDALLLPLRTADAISVLLPTFDPHRFCALAARYQATGCGLTPPMATTLLEPGVLDGHDLSSLRQLVLSRPPGGAGLASALAEALPGVGIGPVLFERPGPVSPALTGRSGPVSRPAGGPEVAPLSASQDGMVWHEQFTPGSFNLSPPIRRLRGHLDVAAFESAMNEIVRRHAALRTQFSIVGGRAVQVFPPHRGFELPVIDVSDFTAAEKQAALEDLVVQARSRPFDLVTGPPFEPTLVRLGPEDHVMVLRAHHAVYDDWSVGVFRREISALYRAFVAGEPSPLRELPVELPEVVRRQARALAGEAGAAERSFWGRELQGAPLSVQLPVDDPSRPEGSPHQAPAPMSLEIPSDLAGALKGIAKSHRATVFMMLLAGFGVLVQRYTGQDDLLVSTLAANRPGTDLEGLIGCFGKKVLVRLRLTDNPTFPQLVTRTRRALMAALAHQGMAYESVLQEMLGPAAAAHGLSPQVGLKFQAAITPREGLDLPGLTIGAVDLPPAEQPAHFLAGDEGPERPVRAGDTGPERPVRAGDTGPERPVRAGDTGPERPVRAGDTGPEAPGWGSGLYLGVFLGLSVVETQHGLRLVTEGVFHPPEVERLLAHFRILLTDIATDPSRPISELAVVDDSEPSSTITRGDCFSRSGGPLGPLAGETSLHQAFADPARRSPDRIAVVFGDLCLTYAELDERTDHLAGRLRAAGVQPETPVALLVGHGVDQVAGALGIWKAGGAVVPLNPTDGSELVRGVLNDAGCSVVVADTPFRGAATTVIVGSGSVERSRPVPTATEPAHLAWVHHDPLSGPGVEIEHGSLLAVRAGMASAVYPPGAERLRVGVAALPRSGAFVRGLLAVTGGHTLHLTPGWSEREQPSCLSLVEDGVIDLLDCLPTDLAALLAGGLQTTLDRRSGGPRPILVVASDRAASPELWNTWRHIRGASVHSLYGPAECGFGATSCAVSDGPRRPSIGRPVADVGAYVVDPKGRAVPTRALGSLEVGGAVVARGYRDQPTLTAERFGCRDDDRVFRTGQLARRMPDATIQLLASPDDRINIRGFPVEPARIEAALADCPGVAEIDVVARHDGPLGPHLVAHVVPRNGEPPPTVTQLRRWLWQRLPGYAWPAFIVGASPSACERPREIALLTRAWAELSGVEQLSTGANYWQSFAFLEALAEVHSSGSPVATPQVLRNRTLETLAVDLATAGPSGGPGPTAEGRSPKADDDRA